MADWQAARWTPTILKEEFGACKSSMRFIPSSKLGKIIWEAECKRYFGTISEFINWLSDEPDEMESTSIAFDKSVQARSTQAGKKRKRDPSCVDVGAHIISDLKTIFPRDRWCGYMDYMHFEEVFADRLDAVEGAVNLSKFRVDPTKLQSRPTLWIGSPGSNTQCHYDTYGFNLVGQVHGSKKWWLYPPSATPSLYPTRIPYEESSVYSQVFVPSPDLDKFPLFQAAECHFVVLQPGDVLYIPKHWWHFAVSVDVTVSVNQWVDVPSDSEDRLRESIVRFLMSSLLDRAGPSLHLGPAGHCLNPNEDLWDHAQCLEAFHAALSECCDMVPQGEPTLMELLLRCLTDGQVLDACVSKLLSAVRGSCPPIGPAAESPGGKSDSENNSDATCQGDPASHLAITAEDSERCN
eukprot:GGOE01061688.1.p1 GENE.GGOE01061688.1~~GGOE01061688.1.p1  ORF type:complete len:446 (-),score=58.72 GGOE01061688.1:36-1259(-)